LIPLYLRPQSDRRFALILAFGSRAVNRKASNAPEKSIKRHENQAGSLNFFAPDRIFTP